MGIYRDRLDDILHDQQKLLALCNEEFVRAPEGYLISTSNNGDRYYYHKIGSAESQKKISLFHKPEIVRALARKEFLRQDIAALEHNIRVLERAQKQYIDDDFNALKAGMRKAYADLPDEFFLESNSGGLNIYRQADRHCIERHYEWAAAPYEKSTYKPERLIHPTSAGFKVRSKSEQHIVEQLVNYGVPFRYEQVIRLDGTPYSSDFTFEDYKREEFYWEHAGMMDEPYYANRHKRKMNIFEAHGIVPWRNLIITYDSDGSVNVPLIKSIIEDEVIPRL